MASIRHNMLSMLQARWEEVRHEVVDLSGFIHENVEPAGAEVACSRRIVATLRAAGMHVDSPVAGLATAFVGRAGAPAPARTTVAFLCEYDGLPPYGQSCGHNVVTAASVAAGLLLLPFAEQADLQVRIVGTPAEEGFGGKRDLADAGVFDDVDACLLVYPGMDDIALSRTLFARGYTVTVSGRASHAAAHPELGVSALDALVAGYVAMSLIRHTAPLQARVHAIISDGGRYPQVIPDRAQARVVVRAASAPELEELAARVISSFTGVGAALGAHVEVEAAPRGAVSVRQNRELGRVYESALRSLGRVPAPIDVQAGAWSTDAGYLSRVVPVLQPQVRMTGRGISPHSREFHEASVGPDADVAIEAAAMAMALTALALAGDAAFRGRVRAEFLRGASAGLPSVGGVSDEFGGVSDE